MHDLEDLSNRLLRIVSGRLGTAAQTGLTQDAVLIARNLGPAELLEYDRRRLKAVLLEEGSLTSHMTIVARAMGVPVIGRLHDIRHSVEDGEAILVDGDNGSVIVRPTRQLTVRFRPKDDAQPEAPRRVRRGPIAPGRDARRHQGQRHGQCRAAPRMRRRCR